MCVYLGEAQGEDFGYGYYGHGYGNGYGRSGDGLKIPYKDAKTRKYLIEVDDDDNLSSG